MPISTGVVFCQVMRGTVPQGRHPRPASDERKVSSEYRAEQGEPDAAQGDLLSRVPIPVRLGTPWITGSTGVLPPRPQSGGPPGLRGEGSRHPGRPASGRGPEAGAWFLSGWARRGSGAWGFAGRRGRCCERDGTRNRAQGPEGTCRIDVHGRGLLWVGERSPAETPGGSSTGYRSKATRRYPASAPYRERDAPTDFAHAAVFLSCAGKDGLGQGCRPWRL